MKCEKFSKAQISLNKHRPCIVSLETKNWLKITKNWIKIFVAVLFIFYSFSIMTLKGMEYFMDQKITEIYIVSLNFQISILRQFCLQNRQISQKIAKLIHRVNQPIVQYMAYFLFVCTMQLIFPWSRWNFHRDCKW